MTQKEEKHIHLLMEEALIHLHYFNALTQLSIKRARLKLDELGIKHDHIK